MKKLSYQIKIARTTNNTYWLELFDAISGLRYEYIECMNQDHGRHTIETWAAKYNLKTHNQPTIYWQTLPFSFVLKNH